MYNSNLRKTVLHTIDTTGPGGAETVFIELCKRLDPEQYRSVAVVTGHGWVHDELKRVGVEPIIVPTTGSFDFRYLLGLIGVVRRQNVDIIQSHLFGSNVYSSLAGLLTRTPVVSTFHGPVDISASERFKSLKFQLLGAGSSKVVFVSDYLKRYFLPVLRNRTHKAVTIYNGVDTERFVPGRNRELRKQLGIQEQDYLVGAIGNIRESKGYDILLRAASELANSHERIKFLIVGDGSGPLYRGLLELHKALGLENTVYFTGFRTDIPSVLHNFDAFVLSSTSEGFSISTIEAMACELPIVATKCGGPQEILEPEKHGILVASGSHTELASAIRKMESEKATAAFMARNGRAHACAKFSIDAMIDSYGRLYRDILSSA